MKGTIRNRGGGGRLGLVNSSFLCRWPRRA